MSVTALKKERIQYEKKIITLIIIFIIISRGGVLEDVLGLEDVREDTF